MKILVVEDDQADSDLISSTLLDSQSDNETMTASSAEEARAAIESFQPDVITLDSDLRSTTVSDTMELIEEFKMLAGVIVLTGHPTEAHAWESRHAGADDYLSKSVLSESPQTLLDAIRDARSAFRYRTIGENGKFKKANMTKSQRITALEIEKYTIKEPKFQPTPEDILKQATPVEKHLLESRDTANVVLASIVRGLNTGTNVTFKNKRAVEHLSAVVEEVKRDQGKEKTARGLSDDDLKILMARNALLDKWLDRIERLLARIRIAAEYCAKNFLKVLGLAVSGALALAVASWVWTHCFHSTMPPVQVGP